MRPRRNGVVDPTVNKNELQPEANQVAQPEIADQVTQATTQVDEVTQAIIDAGKETAAIKQRITEMSVELKQEGADKDALQEEFKNLMKRLNELNKVGKTGTKKKGGKRDVTSTKLGILKDALVSFQPRNTAITLEGNITAIGVDGRNGFHIITITHATGMKFTKKVDAIELVNPTEELSEKLAQLVAEQETAIAEAKEAKKAKDAEAKKAKDAEGDEDTKSDTEAK